MTGPSTRARTGQLDLDVSAPEVHDHVCAVGHGPEAFTETVAALLDRTPEDDLLVVAGHLTDSPLGRLVQRHGVAHDNLVLMDPDEGYRSLTDPDAVREVRAAWGAIVDAALAEGHRTVRIVADNTARLAGASPADRASWWDWEHAADAWQAVRPVTGTCWFDADRVDPTDVWAALHRHALANGPAVPWRVFTRARPDGGRPLDVVVAGVVGPDDVDTFRTVLRGTVTAATEEVDGPTDVGVDLTGADLCDRARSVLADLTEVARLHP